MPNPRKELLVNGETYHVFNKSIAEEEIFVAKRDLNRCLDLINFYRIPQKIRYSRFKNLPKTLKEDIILKMKNAKPLVDINAFSFMPNHFHFLLKQNKDDGIAHFISLFQNGFAKFRNKKYNRLGGVFIRPFKSKRITSDEILLHVSRYIHLNPVTSYLLEFDDLKNYPWTSYPYYLGKSENNLVNTKMIFSLLGSSNNYEEFLRDQVDYQRSLNLIKHYTFESKKK